MKYLTAAFLCLLISACSSQKRGEVELKTSTDTVSYTIGMNIGRDAKQSALKLNVDALAMGLADQLEGKAKFTDEQTQKIMTALQTSMQAEQQKKMEKAGAENKAAGEKFLAENKSKPGVVTLPSGLQYKVITMGTGPKPKDTDMVTTHYRGTLIDGKEFDSSFKRGQPATFPCNRVIKGWTEALQLMPVGSKWQLFVPSDLAYGPAGAGQDIGPNSTLIFEVELLEIKPAQK